MGGLEPWEGELLGKTGRFPRGRFVLLVPVSCTTPKLLMLKSEGLQVSVLLVIAGSQRPCGFLGFAAGARKRVLGGDMAGAGALLP